MLEPAGALSVAGLKKYVKEHVPEAERASKRYVAITSGANMNFPTLRYAHCFPFAPDPKLRTLSGESVLCCSLESNILTQNSDPEPIFELAIEF